MPKLKPKNIGGDLVGGKFLRNFYCKKPDIFSVKTFSKGNLAKLFSLIKKSSSFFLCIQEAKISNLTNIDLSILDKYNVSFHFLPVSNNSGGFSL